MLILLRACSATKAMLMSTLPVCESTIIRVTVVSLEGPSESVAPSHLSLVDQIAVGALPLHHTLIRTLCMLSLHE